MLDDPILKSRWEQLNRLLQKRFSEQLDIQTIIYIIGLQELGRFKKPFKKDDKINLMHIATCKLLEPYGYYQFTHFDQEGWPHYQLIEKLPNLKPGEQTLMLKQAIVQYFVSNGLIQ